MAVDMFLKIADIKGESKDSAYKDSIDVLAWSWGLTQSGSMHTGGGGGAGKADVHNLSITKWVDKASPNLIKFCCNGKHFAEMSLIVRKAGEKPVEYIVMTLKEVIIASVSTGGSGGEDRLTENVSLNFGEFEYKYTPQKDDGTADAEIQVGYDIRGNKVT